MSLKHKLAATVSLLNRYRTIWRYFWSVRESITPKRLSEDEAEFQPAALSVETRPVSPAARWTSLVLILMFLLAVLWSIFGEIDIVVNAHGKVIPTERTKSISSVNVSVIRSVHVAEGQAVKAGDLLIELDPRSNQAEFEKANSEQENALLSIYRWQALIEAIDSNTPPKLAKLSAPLMHRRQEVFDHVSDQWIDYKKKRARYESEIIRYKDSLDIAIKRAADYAELARTGDVSHHAWLEKDQQRIDLLGLLNDARNQKEALFAETRRAAQDALFEARRINSAASHESMRTSIQGEWLRIRAPIDGTVQQLVAHTVGAAVPAAQTLMQIVPRSGSIEIEAHVENKDVGFLQEGQEASVKIDAFEYTKYGTLQARVSHVSRDAIQDEKRGLIYLVKIELKQNGLMINGRDTPVGVGMSGTVEIKTGRRKMIEYLLSPLLRHTRESVRER